MSAVPRSADVVVVGGGAIGMSAAYALARRGVAVVVLERDRIGSGASAGTACMVTPSHADRMASPGYLRQGIRDALNPGAPVALRPRPGTVGWMSRFARASLRSAAADAGSEHLRDLARRSLELHRRWSNETGTGLVENGTLNIWSGKRAERRRDAAVEAGRTAGFEMLALDSAEIAALEPDVQEADFAALCPEDGHVDSLRFVERVASGARTAGARISEGIEVVHISRSGRGVRVETTRGTITCGHVVLAAGVWSRRFAGDLEARIPVTAAKGYHVEYEGFGDGIQRPIYLSDARVVATPLEGRLRIAGTLEIGTDPERIDMRRVDAVRHAGERHVRGLVLQSPTGIWKGLRPMSADDMPLVGPVPGDPRVTLATGHGTLGITLAPVTGELVADQVTGMAVEPDPLLDPARFLRRR
jgi:D-amino-acid dehydrogenase